MASTATVRRYFRRVPSTRHGEPRRRVPSIARTRAAVRRGPSASSRRSFSQERFKGKAGLLLLTICLSGLGAQKLPSSAWETTSFTPRRPRRLSLREALGPKGLRLRGADVRAETLSAAVRVGADGNDDRHRDDAVIAARRHVGRLEPDIRPVAFERPRSAHGAMESALRERLAPTELHHQPGHGQCIFRRQNYGITQSFMENHRKRNDFGLFFWLRHSLAMRPTHILTRCSIDFLRCSN